LRGSGIDCQPLTDFLFSTVTALNCASVSFSTLVLWTFLGEVSLFPRVT
jgi:hypothetical protein